MEREGEGGSKMEREWVGEGVSEGWREWIGPHKVHMLYAHLHHL